VPAALPIRFSPKKTVPSQLIVDQCRNEGSETSGGRVRLPPQFGAGSIFSGPVSAVFPVSGFPRSVGSQPVPPVIEERLVDSSASNLAVMGLGFRWIETERSDVNLSVVIVDSARQPDRGIDCESLTVSGIRCVDDSANQNSWFERSCLARARIALSDAIVVRLLSIAQRRFGARAKIRGAVRPGCWFARSDHDPSITREPGFQANELAGIP